jgi:ATP-dependent Clp protease ATP-binding subunit ClpC
MMEFQFYVFVQEHDNRTFTMTALPFPELNVFGHDFEQGREQLREMVTERIKEMPAQFMHRMEYREDARLEKVEIELRPTDGRSQRKRRERVNLTFSLVVSTEEDGQLLVTVPKLKSPTLTFYVYDESELLETAQVELVHWFEGSTLEDMLDYRYANEERLETLTVEVEDDALKSDGDDDYLFSSLTRFSFGEENEYWALKEVGINLTEQINLYRPTYRRDEEVDEVLRNLAGKRANSIMLTGPSEVGKSAIIHEVVRRIKAKECDPALHDRQVWLLTPDRLIAGAQYIGTWEERVADIVKECKEEGHILYVEDLPGLLEIGRWSKSDQNVGQAFKPHIETGEIAMLGEALPERVTLGDQLSPGFMAVFRRIQVESMPESEARDVLRAVRRDLERELELQITPDAIDKSVALTRRFLPYRAFPGKGVRLLEQTANDVARKFRQDTVKGEHVTGAFCGQTGLPAFIVNDREALDLAEVERQFAGRVIGQPEAVRAMVNLIATIKAGLNDPDKPLGSFLFIGPTGVGKTEMAKTLADFLFGAGSRPEETRLLRYDMSEYADHDGAARLIGSLGAEGKLIQEVRAQPFCVVLLDEIEKASPHVFDVLLQVLGEGRLTGAGGRSAYFHNAIVVMTSNLGSTSKAIRATGFGADTEEPPLEMHYRDQVEAYFRPEFVNRLDKVVVFRALDRDSVRKIARRELRDILRRDGIARRNVLVEIGEDVIDLLLQQGYSPAFGARPLKRAIERLLIAPLARALAQRPLRDQANLINLGMQGGEVAICVVPLKDEREREGARVHFEGGSATPVDEIVAGFSGLRRQLDGWSKSGLVQDMQRERSELLRRTNAPGFWDQKGEAPEMLKRFYGVDRLLRRIAQLSERVDYLEDLAEVVANERDITYQADMARSYEELRNAVAYLDIELSTAHLPHRSRAAVLINGIGIGAPSRWPRQLGEIYMRWARRKGYGFEVYILGTEPHYERIAAHDDFDDLLKCRPEESPVRSVTVLVEGSNVFGFLKGETGLHKRIGEGGRPDEIAQVRVLPLADGTEIDSWLEKVAGEYALASSPARYMEKHTVIRTYSPGHYVRDLRTGLRLTNIQDVLKDGMIDPFILTYLEQESV